MDGAYPPGGNPPPHMVGYYQGMPGLNVGQASMPAGSSPNSSRPPNSISIWAGDLDAYMDENFLRQAVSASGWGPDITRIKVVRDHYSGMHAGYGFLDAASPEAAERVIATGSGMPIPGTNRCWRLNMGRNAAVPSVSSAGAEINIYVGNLEPSVTDYQLMTAFRPRYASVRHAKVVCNEYGQSRGFGFVRFASPQDAERAVSEMQGFEFNNKPIRLSPATGRARGGRGQPHGGGGGGGGGGYGGHHSGQHQGHPHHGAPTNKRPRQLVSPDDPNNTTIFIGGTGSHITDELLWREFSNFGELDAVRVPVNKTGFAFVRFKTRECAQRAKEELSGTHYVSLNPHKPVRVEWASEQIPITKPPPMVQHAMPMMYPGPASSQPYDPQYDPPYNPAQNLNSPAGNSVPQQAFNAYQPSAMNTSGPVPPASSGPGGLTQGGTPQTSNGMNGDENKAHGSEMSIGTSDGHEMNVKVDGASGPGGGETEPPSKRAAVGRSEYAGVPADGMSNGKKDGLAEIKAEGATEDSPAMQFSWLNSSSTQPASNPQ